MRLRELRRIHRSEHETRNGSAGRGHLACAAAATAAVGTRGGAEAAPKYTLRAAARGLNQPVYVTAPASERNRLYVVSARLVRVVTAGRLQARPFLDLQVLVDRTGERGLLSIGTTAAAVSGASS